MRVAQQFGILIGLALVVSLASARAVGASQVEEARQSGVTVVRDDADGLAIVYEPPGVGLEPTADPRSGWRVGARNHVERYKPGEPDISAAYFWFGIPAAGEPRLVIESVELEPFATTDVAPIPDIAGTFEDYGPVYERNAALYSGAPFPERLASLSMPRTLGAQRYAGLVLFPAQWDPASGELRRVARMRARVEFPRAQAARGEPIETLRESAEARLSEMLVNYETARAFRDAGLARRDAGKARDAAGSTDGFTSSPVWMRIEVPRTGVYHITHADLVAAGIANPTQEIGATSGLRVYNGGGLEVPEPLDADRPEWMKQVPILVRDGANGSFDAGDEIVFYALGPGGFFGEYDPSLPDSARREHFRTRFTNVNVFWLTWGGTFDEPPARLLPSLDGAVVAGSGAAVATDFLHTTHDEQDLINDFTRFGEDGWFWADMSNVSAEAASVFLSATGSPGAVTDSLATLKVRLYGHRQSEDAAYGEYRSVIEWNSVQVDDKTWNDRGTPKRWFDHIVTGQLASGGGDTLRVRLFNTPNSQSSREVYMCWFELAYRRRYSGLGQNTFFFSSPGASAGRVHYDVAGMGGTPNLLLDVTDPFAARDVAGGSLAGGVYSFERTEEGLRRYVLTNDSGLLKPTRIALFEIENLRDPSIRADYVIITNDELRSSVEPIRSLRARDFTVRVVSLSQIAAQFGWGVAQPAAIRDFLNYALFNWDEGRGPTVGFVPEYVLLVGDATVDYRGIKTTGNRNLMPAHYQVASDGTGVNTFGTDDYYTYLDPLSATEPALSVGRIPAGDGSQVAVVADKLIGYELDPELGSWRSRIVFAADDEMKGCSDRSPTSNCWDSFFYGGHTFDVETAAATIPSVYLERKVYMCEFPFGNQSEKPAAKRSYIDELREGCLLSHYSGHGAFDKMADENLFFTSDADAARIGNGRKLYIYTAYSCTIGKYDLDDASSISEQLLFSAGGASIATLASDAPAFAGSSRTFAVNFVRDFFQKPGARRHRMGESVRAAKSAPEQIRSRTNDEKYQVLGDPALLMGTPQLPVRIDPHDTFVGGTFTSVSGSVLQDDQVATSFNGTATVTVAGVADTSGYVFFPPYRVNNAVTGPADTIRYSLQGGALYTGSVPVTNGRWQAQFFVPADIRQGNLALIHAYVSNNAVDGAGILDSLVATRATEIDSSVAADLTGPELAASLDGRVLRPNVTVVASSTLDLRLSDEHGINLQGEDDFFSISVTIDERTPGERTTDLTRKFEYDFGDFRAGGLSVAFASLVPTDFPLGTHTITIQASDNLNNRTKTTTVIEVVGDLGEFEVLRTENFPNPFSDQTIIEYKLTQDADAVTVGIYTVNGRLIREFRNAPSGVSNEGIVWDGRDHDGDLVANGLYFLKVVATAADGTESEAIGRAVVMRN